MFGSEQVRAALSSRLNVTLPPDFFTSFYGVRPCHLRPCVAKAPAFGWEDLNRAISHHRLQPPRLRVTHSKPEQIADLHLFSWTSTQSAAAEPALKVGALLEALERGGTLVLDRVDELSTEMGSFSAAMMALLEEPVGANCYASFGADDNYGPHWDEHDVFALQMQGEKRWALFPRESPEEPFLSPRPDTSKNAYVVTLQEGDVLYVPRGCWHEVTGLAKPSLHISVGIARTRPLDLLKQLIVDLEEDAFWDASIPRLSGDAALSRFEVEFAGQLAALVNTPVSTKTFLQQRSLKLRRSPAPNLPWSLSGAGPIADNIEIVWRAPAMQIAERGDREIVLAANGAELRLPSPARSVVETIKHGPARYGALRAHGGLEEETLRRLLDLMARRGMIELHLPGPSSEIDLLRGGEPVE